MHYAQLSHEAWQYASLKSQAKAGLKLSIIRPQPLLTFQPVPTLFASGQ